MNLFNEHVDPVIRLIYDKLSEPIQTVELQLVSSLCNLLECLLSKKFGFKSKQEKLEELKRLVTYIFAYAFVWSVGATVHDSRQDEINAIVREQFSSVLFPSVDNVFAFYLDIQDDLTFKPWHDRTAKFVFHSEVPNYNLLVPTIDTSRYSYIIELLMGQNKEVYLTGASGTGKSVLLLALLEKVQNEPFNIDHFRMIFSGQTSSLITQQTIESKLEKIKKTLLGSKANRKTAIFIDDINMPIVELYGAQPPIELLRLLIDKKGFYDRKERYWKSVENIM